MRYAMLLKPHANTRYRQSLQTLALAELKCELQAWGMESEPRLALLGGEPFLVFDAEGMEEAAWRSLSRHSGCCLAAELHGELLKPLPRGSGDYFPEELPQLLKYKGKTNADFTMMLLHCAKAASGFAREEGPLEVLDPVCGKATTLFCALQEGNSATGVDVDEKALREADEYFQRLLKLHRYKHRRQERSLTLPGGGAAEEVVYEVADTPEHQKQGDVRTLRLIHADAGSLSAVTRKGGFHLAVGDLPYGVQHAPKESRGLSSLERLAGQVSAGCAKALRPGGVLALSFNLYTLRREKVIAAMEAAGLTALDSPPYNGFRHWVEQAVDRDAVIARKQ